MNINQILPFVTTPLMLVFAAWVFVRYWQRRTMALLMWCIGLALFAVAAFAEAYSVFGFNDLVFRLWYLCGAVLTAAWIGQGTVYLLLRQKWGTITLAILSVLSLVATVIMFTTPFDPLAVSRFNPTVPLSEQYATKELRPNDPIPTWADVFVDNGPNGPVRIQRGIIPLGVPIRATTGIFNIYGTIALVGGALYSTFLFWRKRVMGNRVIGNILIAAGALTIASGSTLTRLGFGAFLYPAEWVAAIVMFVGFFVAMRRDRATQAMPSPAT